jgi:protein-disulfide isomerase
MRKYSGVFLILSFLFFPNLLVAAPTDSVATLNGQAVTEQEVTALTTNQMMKVNSQIYEIKRDAIDQIIQKRLLEAEAKKKGLSVDALLKKEVYDKVVAPTEVELRSIYEMKKSRMQGKTFEEVKEQLESQVKSQKKQMAFSKYLDTLRNVAKILYKIERPTVKVSVDDDPSQGDKNAPITLIEFSEFQCPYCKKARPTIDKILSTYKGKIHYVFRDFPLGFHNQAKDAANAAQCANEQGKYWDYSHALWENQGKQSLEKLKEIAQSLALDTAKFDACVASKKYYKEIDKDQDDGSEAGVSGTPAYFINGKFLSGAQPFEAFKEIIDEELAKLK